MEQTKDMSMKTDKQTHGIEFLYLIGVVVALFMVAVSFRFYPDTELPLFFSLSTFGAYCGIFLRGLFHPCSYGKKPTQRRFSTRFGFASWFVVVLLEFILLLFTGLSNLDIKTKFLLFCLGIVAIGLLFLGVYYGWYRKKVFE